MNNYENKAQEWFFIKYGEAKLRENTDKLAEKFFYNIEDQRKKEKKLKQFQMYIIQIFVPYNISHAYFHKKVSPVVESLKSVDAVILGALMGKYIDSSKPMMLILSGSEIHVLIDTPIQAGLGIIGLFGSMAREKAKPFTHTIHTVSSFVESFNLGEEHILDNTGWSYATFLDKYNISSAYRPAMIDFYNKAIEIKNGISSNENIEISSIESELKIIKKLYDQNLITEEEYQKKKKAILKI